MTIDLKLTWGLLEFNAGFSALTGAADKGGPAISYAFTP